MNILEKYYLQGKGKIILGTFALIVLSVSYTHLTLPTIA